VVDGVDEGRQDRVIEGGIAADGDDGLVHAEGPELAEPARDPHARPHRVQGLEGVEAAG